MVKRFVLVISSVNRKLGRSCSFLVLVIGFITLYEVVVRFVFNNPTIWATEMAKLVFGAYVILGGGYALVTRSHIRVDILYERLSPRRQVIADLATCGFGFLFLGLLLVFGVRMAWYSILIKEFSATVFGPILYPSKICLVIGVLLLFLQLMAKFIYDIQIVRGVESPLPPLKGATQRE